MLYDLTWNRFSAPSHEELHAFTPKPIVTKTIARHVK